MIKRKQNKIISLIFICALCAFFGVTVSAQGVTDSAGLQAAINEASPGDTVSIAENITLTGTLAVNKSLTFKGENGNVSIFPETDARHMTVTGDNVVLKFDGVILDGGNTGGGIFSSADSLTLEDAEIKDCKAGNGGGIYSTKDLIIRDSRITGNKSSANGGGVYGFEHITISKTVLSGNTAAENGGAVYIDDHA
ncbi:MAG: hypothetical protein FWF08_01300, partial [Oscillospiraceae bacterium]|nr:hypothetical protein [Oscillospiraceae bacterium]